MFIFIARVCVIRIYKQRRTRRKLSSSVQFENENDVHTKCNKYEQITLYYVLSVLKYNNTINRYFIGRALGKLHTS